MSTTEKLPLRKKVNNVIRAKTTMLSNLLRDLGQFLKEIRFSLLTLLMMGAMTLGAWYWTHQFNRVFPVTFLATSGDIVWAEYAYPYQESRFSSLTTALISILLPIAVILIAQFWIRSFLDAANAILGLSFSLLTSTFVSVILKKTIGGLRPHFLTGIMFSVAQVCTGNVRKIHNALESFPSGHSVIAFAGLFYLSVYLFTHLGVQSQHRVNYTFMVLCVLPTLLATYLASAMVLEYHHHSHDAVFGAAIGAIMALMGYRMVFGSIFDGKLNAIPSGPEPSDKEASPENAGLPQ